MAKTKILIAGASGFIGRNLFEYFNSLDNWEAYGTYFRNIPNDWISVNTITPADLRGREIALSKTRGMDVVINCAALTEGVGAYNPSVCIPANIQINQNLIEAAFINKVKHFIFLSCTVMYPSSIQPLNEHEYDLEKVHPKYSLPAKLKIIGEDLCQVYSGLGQTKYTAIRHTNIYGPYDKFDLHRGHVLAATIEKVMTAEEEIVVWGSGNETRDFLYISDLITFIEAAIDRQKNNFEVLNAGYGKTCSVKDLVQKIIFCSGKKVKVNHDLNKPTIETQMNIDIRKAKEILGWKPEINLSEGLSMSLDWYRRQREVGNDKS